MKQTTICYSSHCRQEYYAKAEKIFFNLDSLHASLNSDYKIWSYKKKKHKKMKSYRKSVQKEPTVKRCLLILDLQSFRSQVKGKHFIDREFQTVAVQGKRSFRSMNSKFRYMQVLRTIFHVIMHLGPLPFLRFFLSSMAF